MELSFSKYEGLGNDFIVVELPTGTSLSDAQVVRLCDRHLGVGADGVLFTGVRSGRPFMKVVNADGSHPEMCGNGLRCVALYLVQTGRLAEGPSEIDTEAGPHNVETSLQGESGYVVVGMRAASLLAADVMREGSGEWLDHPFEVDGVTLRVSTVSMGNPHVVLFDGFKDWEATLGPRVERDERLRAGANVNFASLEDATTIDLRVWERGVGFTQACGTGACATAVAAVQTGRAPRGETITVRLPGGPLEIVVRGPGERIEMRGPARRVFRGVVQLGDCAA